MRKYHLFIFILLVFTKFANAQYQIKIKAINTLDTVIYFRGTVFDEKNFIPKDTINLSKGSFTLNAKKPILGGIYFFYFPKTKSKIYFSLENKDSLKVELTGANYLDFISFSNSKNKAFIEYQQLEKKLSNYDTLFAKELAQGKKFNLAQKAAFFKLKTNQLVYFRTNAMEQMKKTDALYLHFNALNLLDESVPSKKNYAARDEFIKQFDFKSPKLLFTPNLRAILSEYFSYFTLQADSISKGVDTVMKGLDCKMFMAKYVVDYLTKLLKNREIVNNTEGYKKFVQSYLLNDKCKVLDAKEKTTYKEEIANISILSLQDTCVNMILKDTGNKEQNLHEFAKQFSFTVIMFYDPTCEHCKIELPKMDSVLNLLNAKYNIKIGRYAVCNEPNMPLPVWKDFINKYSLTNNYVHVNLGANVEIRKSYDAFTNPIFYLIDNKGILIGKKLSPLTLRNMVLANYLK
jgi:thiol-disulfide isomerase/thioredoxin